MAFDLKVPQVLCTTKIEGDRHIEQANLFDVKFYPHFLDGGDQYFAIAGTSQVIVCRTRHGEDPPFEILRWFHSPGDSMNSIEWTIDERGRPMVCVAGQSPRHISIIDVESASTRTLAGHGRAINDLAISPVNPKLLASASEDFSIRLWNLDPAFHTQPCVAVLAGDGHKQPVLSCSFHSSGRWLLSGGMDCAVILWQVPDIDGKVPEQGIAEPLIIFHPHFFSAEIHDNVVDCIRFFGDLIISRCARSQGESSNEILIWKIDGFDSSAHDSPAPPTSIPDKYTRSAFNESPLALGFQRLATLDMPNTDRFYLRFGLFQNGRPMLCMSNQHTKFCFWDLQRLEEDLLAEPAGELAKRGPFDALAPHHTIVAPTDHHWAASSSAWSPDGRWMIAVGEAASMIMMHRDG